KPAMPTKVAPTPVKTVAVSSLPTTGFGPNASSDASNLLAAAAIFLIGVASLLTMRIRRR
ncbi:MAG TPA: hypothetical protein VNP95_00990, partial [Thermomicrobiales bacterium]|nr:hypothetical protein [Thermomicrobiales bacterium]